MDLYISIPIHEAGPKLDTASGLQVAPQFYHCHAASMTLKHAHGHSARPCHSFISISSNFSAHSLRRTIRIDVIFGTSVQASLWKQDHGWKCCWPCPLPPALSHEVNTKRMAATSVPLLLTVSDTFVSQSTSPNHAMFMIEKLDDQLSAIFRNSSKLARNNAAALAGILVSCIFSISRGTASVRHMRMDGKVLPRILKCLQLAPSRAHAF